MPKFSVPFTQSAIHVLSNCMNGINYISAETNDWPIRVKGAMMVEENILTI